MQYCIQNRKNQWVFVQLSALRTRYKGYISYSGIVFNAEWGLVFANPNGNSRDCLLGKMKTRYRKLMHEYEACTTKPPKNPLSIRILNVKPIRVHCLDVLVPVTEAESGNHLFFAAMNYIMQGLDCSYLLNCHTALQQWTSLEMTSSAKLGLQMSDA